MGRPLPEDFGLTERLIDEVHARDQRQARLFVDILLWGAGVLWLTFGVLVYANSARRSPLLGLLMAPLLGGLGAVIGSLPVAVLSGILSWLRYPPHPMARALAQYQAATAGFHVCDVCRLARGDSTPKEGTAYCSRCGAWICPECRPRYDLRAIAALKRARQGRGDPGGASDAPG